MAKREERDRCLTGIEGLDNILGGGVPLSNAVLLAGACGTGKTILGFEFLVRGMLSGEPGMFISSTETPERLFSNIPSFVFFNDSMLGKGKLTILPLQELMGSAGLPGSDMDEASVKKLVAAMAKMLAAHKARRLVIDALDAITSEIKDVTVQAMLMKELSALLQKNACTAMLVTGPESCDRVEGRIADGIIVMGNLERRGDLLRTMQVMKMKGTRHSRSKYVIDLTSAGVLVTPLLKGGL
jgi:circadian clock protein KaiC